MNIYDRRKHRELRALEREQGSVESRPKPEAQAQAEQARAAYASLKRQLREYVRARSRLSVAQAKRREWVLRRLADRCQQTSQLERILDALETRR